jgi:hypothetical protein
LDLNVPVAHSSTFTVFTVLVRTRKLTFPTCCSFSRVAYHESTSGTFLNFLVPA